MIRSKIYQPSVRMSPVAILCCRCRPWGYLGSWVATRDFWRIAGWECLLKLPIQFVVKFLPFAFFAGPLMLRHCAISMLDYLETTSLHKASACQALSNGSDLARNQRLVASVRIPLGFNQHRREQPNKGPSTLDDLCGLDPVWRRGKGSSGQNCKRAEQDVIR